MKDAAGNKASLNGHAIGARILTIVDHDHGTLSFRVNEGEPLKALHGFTPGTALRPFASLGNPGERVTFAPPYLSCNEESVDVLA